MRLLTAFAIISFATYALTCTSDAECIAHVKKLGWSTHPETYKCKSVKSDPTKRCRSKLEDFINVDLDEDFEIQDGFSTTALIGAFGFGAGLAIMAEYLRNRRDFDAKN